MEGKLLSPPTTLSPGFRWGAPPATEGSLFLLEIIHAFMNTCLRFLIIFTLAVLSSAACSPSPETIEATVNAVAMVRAEETLAARPTSTPGATLTSQPTYTPVGTDEPQPTLENQATYTPRPTYTPAPTWTPEPAAAAGPTTGSSNGSASSQSPPSSAASLPFTAQYIAITNKEMQDVLESLRPYEFEGGFNNDTGSNDPLTSQRVSIDCAAAVNNYDQLLQIEIRSLDDNDPNTQSAFTLYRIAMEKYKAVFFPAVNRCQVALHNQETWVICIALYSRQWMK